MNSQTLIDAITAEQTSHIALLQSLIRAPSPNPPGDTRAAAAVLQTYLNKTHNISTTLLTAPNHPDLPNLTSSFYCSGPSGPRLILNGHLDVFPPSPDDPNPWSGELINGRIHGRGTVDMKAGLAASVIAFAYLHRYRAYLKGSVGLCAVSDEETGGKLGTRWLLDEEEHGDEWKGDVAIDGEPGGLNTVRFAEKGTLRITFRVDVGPGAHGAYTHLSRSATRIAARLVGELGDAVEGMEPVLDPKLKAYLDRKEVREAMDACMGPGAADVAGRCSFNVGIVRGGLKVNMIPGQCVFEVDIRMPLGVTREDVLAVIDGVVDKGGYGQDVVVEVQEAASNPAAASLLDHPIVDILARQAARVSPGVAKPVAIPSLGATDCKHYRYRGIPAYVFGVSPETMGARNESVSVDEFLAVVKTHALAAWEYLGGEM